MIAAHKLSLTPKQVQDLHQLQQTGSSVIIVAIDKKITQIIGVSDVIRPEVAEQLAKLKQAGAKQLVMLTGDNQMTADYVADMLGIDEVHAELLPDEKVQFVKKYQEQGLRVAFIGLPLVSSYFYSTAYLPGLFTWLVGCSFTKLVS